MKKVGIDDEFSYMNGMGANWDIHIKIWIR